MLDHNLEYITGIGPKKAAILAEELQIYSIEDLLYFRPRKYLDRSNFQKIIDCQANQEVTVSGIIKNITLQNRRRKILEVEINDGTGSIYGTFFGGFRYFQKIFKVGEYIFFSGKVNIYNKKQIYHPDFDFIDHESSTGINTGRIIPLYRSTEKLKTYGLNSRGLRKIISIALKEFLECVSDPISSSIIKKYNFIDLKKAIYYIHFPTSNEDIDLARKRLAFNELFFLEYYLILSKKYMQENFTKDKPGISNKLLENFYNNIPFTLTEDQKTSINEITSDMIKPFPMHRLLQGDVGSGKTVVAIAASLISTEQLNQSAIMAPTEVLARQHFNTFNQLVPGNINIELLTGSMTANEKKQAYQNIENGTSQIIIGTHALIQKDVTFKNLGLIIVDEQHRFGVEQRAILKEKGNQPDLLVMTATPIPRSLALTVYGDLDVSYLKQKPSNRLPVTTLSFAESKIKGVYNSIEKYLKQGRQCFYILPLIEESEKIDLKSAKETYELLNNKIFTHRNVALLHSKLKTDEKNNIMNEFKDGKIDILVSTTVVEVGIDIPNANIMAIHHAERFGLSQLHQLRGRVGRGQHQSFCVLIYPDNISIESLHRIKAIENNLDGFKIAEEDLKLRGAGEFIGVRQHGFNSDFTFVDFNNDFELIIMAKNEAEIKVTQIKDISNLLSSIDQHVENKSIVKAFRSKKLLSLIS